MQRPRAKPQKIELLVRQNTRLAKSLWPGELEPSNLFALKKLTRECRLALAAGEISLAERRMVCDERRPITHSKGKPLPWNSCARHVEIE